MHWEGGGSCSAGAGGGLVAEAPHGGSSTFCPSSDTKDPKIWQGGSKDII